MNCSDHPDREAVGACVTCGRVVCAECKEALGGRVYCYTCSLRVPAETPELSGRSSDTNLNWFQSHLNWTMILALLGLSIPVVIAAAIGAATDSVAPVVVIGMMALLGLLMAWGWALRRRNRSLWWILLCLFAPPLGLLIFFYLERRSDNSGGPPRPPQSRITH